MSRYRAGLLPGLVFAILAAGRVTDAADVLMTAAMFTPQPAHRITAVDEAQRTIGLEQLDVVPFPVVTMEGHMLLIVPGPSGQSPAAAIPIEITSLEPGRRLVASFRGAAARHLVAETDVFLVRPFSGGIDMTDPVELEPAPTQAFRDLPDVILPAGGAADAPPPGGDPIAAARNAARRVQASNNLKQIMLALHNFHDAYGCFPPAAVIGPDGRPWHSWRVLLLPFFEEVNLSKQYDFSQPWDAPANLEVAKKAIPVYADPMTDANADTVISYALLVGEQAMFQPGIATMKDAKSKPLESDSLRSKQRLAQVTDGTSNTICVAPFLRDRDVPWTKPDDIVVGAGFPGIGKPGGIAAPYPLPDGSGAVTLVGFGDGSVRILPADLDADTLAALITRSGGEVIDFETLGGGDAGRDRSAMPLLRIIRDGARGVTLEMR